MVPIHDYGEIEGRLFVSMRLINGRDLADVLADGPLDPDRAVRIIDQVAKALHAAQEVGLIHRDIKPSNILLDRDDFAYLIDFGIARAADDTRLTKTGGTIGTFAYIAPERLDSHAEDDARADIYSLACVLYEALTGEPPFAGSTTAHLMFAHAHTPPPQPSSTQPDVPAQVRRGDRQGHAKNPDNRYATTVELADAARDAITVPIARSAPAATLLPTTQQAADPVPTQPMTVAPESPAPATPASPPHTPTLASGISRRTIALIGGAIALVAVIAAAVGIPALVKHRPSQSSPTSSSSPASSARSYGAQIVLPFTGLNRPKGLAVDSAGDVYVADLYNNRVLKLPAGSATQEVLPFIGRNHPIGIAVDTAGTLYVTDAGNNRVLKLPAGSATQEVLPFADLSDPVGIAVSTAGTIYVADGVLATSRVLKLPTDSPAQGVLPFTGINVLAGVAVDGAGTLYVTDFRNDRVLKLPAGSSAQEVVPFIGVNEPWGVAADSAGTLYITDFRNNRVLKLPAGASAQEVLPFTGLHEPISVAVDGAGDLYVAEHANNRVLKLPVQ